MSLQWKRAPGSSLCQFSFRLVKCGRPFSSQRIKQIEEDIPTSVIVGVFCVGCEDIKSSLKSTVRSVSQLLLDVLAKWWGIVENSGRGGS